MALRHVRKTYEEFGSTDPMFAVHSSLDKRGNQWDLNEFNATGEDDVAKAMELLESLGLTPAPGRVLDFGCGAGRLSQALAKRFEQVVGVDISYSMVEFAQEHNHCDGRCEYKVNTAGDLALFDDGTFDFVFSYITLQHVPPETSRVYIAEFLRVLKPGAITLFHVPTGRRYQPGSLAETFYRFTKGPLRRTWKRLRGKPPVEMHHINQEEVKKIILAHGGRLADSQPTGNPRRSRVGMYYAVVREESAQE